MLTLAQLLDDTAHDDNHEAIHASAGIVRWGELAESFAQERQRLRALAGSRLGLSFAATRTGIARLAATQAVGAHVFLIDHGLSEDTRREWAERYELRALLDSSPNDRALSLPNTTAQAPTAEADDQAGSVTILTSGSTGEPKVVQHAWHRLTRPVRVHESNQRPRWLLAFRPHLYAGLQVLFQALLNRGSLTVVGPHDSPETIARLLAEAQVEYASATPSFWRRLLLTIPTDEFRRIPLKQITLGGEVVDQPILDRLHTIFPQARIVHIYATTELGRCFAVADRRAGFPAKLLHTGTSDGVFLKVTDGELFVRSANSMSGYIGSAPATSESANATEDAWFATGDLVEQIEDRVFFAGRRSDLINVGGNKVSPVAVEQTIRRLPEVEEVRVYAQSSSIAGQLVACQVVTHPGVDADAIKQQIRAICLEHLDRYQCPRLIEVVQELPLSDAGKLVRREPGGQF